MGRKRQGMCGNTSPVFLSMDPQHQLLGCGVESVCVVAGTVEGLSSLVFEAGTAVVSFAFVLAVESFFAALSAGALDMERAAFT